MAKVLSFQRPGLTAILEELAEKGPTARGVIVIYQDAAGFARFRIRGFEGKNESFTVCGLLDWVKADILDGLIEVTTDATI